MQSRNIINRRAFCAGILAASAVRASEPIVDLKKKSSPLMLPQKKQAIFQRPEKEFIDLEPAVRGSSNQLFTPHVMPSLHRRRLTLLLRNVHTKEEINLAIPKSLEASKITIKKFDHICRDWRYNRVKTMDPQLLSILAKICEESTQDKTPILVNVLSGFRTEKTNEMLRRKSALVAKNSFHKIGKALDFCLPNVSAHKVKDSAYLHAFGGLGVYKNFLHIDTGPERRWII